MTRVLRRTAPPAVVERPRRPQRTAPPVFVDRSGRRRRIVIFSGVGLAVVLVAGLVLLLAGLSGASSLHVPGFPDANRPARGEAVPTPTPGPEETTAGDGTTPVDATTTGAGQASASAGPTSQRHVPTQTPSHEPRPTKT